jgi:1-acyl-sn-glycerol-3-phosphate acyltransferase
MSFIILSICVLAFVLIGLHFSQTDWGGPHVNWIDGWTRLLCRCLHRQDKHMLSLPSEKGALVVANHVSGLDPLLLITASSRPLRFLIAREQYERWGVHWLFRLAGCIPVDRDKNPEQALRAAKRALDDGEVIALFPHGKIHLDHEAYRPLKKGFAKLAQWAEVPVYAVRIDGVRGEGHILLAPWMPSRVRLQFAEPILITATNQSEQMTHIERQLGPR